MCRFGVSGCRSVHKFSLYVVFLKLEQLYKTERDWSVTPKIHSSLSHRFWILKQFEFERKSEFR